MVKKPDYAKLCRDAGIEADYAYCIDRLDPSKSSVVVRILGELTFEMLSRASVLMGTRDINISCDLGCESDRSHDTEIVFTGMIKEVEE